MDKKALIFFLSLVVGAFALGRYSAPVKIQIEKQVLTSKQAEELLTTDKTKEKITTEVKRPDGSEVKRTRYVNRNIVTAAKTEKEIKIVHEVKEIEKERNRVIFNALGGVNVSDFRSPLFGLHISKELGPFGLGFWVLSNITIGVSLGVGI